MYDNCHDTLLAHHAFVSHFPQRLDHVVSEYCDASPWKIVYGKRGVEEKGLAPQDLTADDLTRYNAADARLTILAWQRMQADLEPERAVYEHDRALAALCREMGRVGIGVDLKRQAELSILLKRRAAALKGQMRSLLGWPDFQPSKLGDVRHALFRRLRVKYSVPTASGLQSTSNATLEALRGTDTKAAKFAGLLLDWRVVMKVRSTYVDAIPINPKTKRAHYNWKPFGTVSGRLSCRLQSCPRPGLNPEDWVRELYVPRPGCVFVYFDVSQAEMRLAAYLAADPVFMAACGADVHAGNAKAVFPDIAARGWLDGEAKKDDKRGKPYRDIAKNLGFAISYGAEVDKVFVTLRSKGFNVTFKAVTLILARLRAAYKVYYKFVERNVEFVKKHGYMRGLRGRIRWFGWYPKPTDISNYPVQEALAAIMNERCIALDKMLPAGCNLVAQIHDACIYECPVKHAAALEASIKAQWAEPVILAGGPLVLPIDLKRGMRWSEL